MRFTPHLALVCAICLGPSGSSPDAEHDSLDRSGSSGRGERRLRSGFPAHVDEVLVEGTAVDVSGTGFVLRAADAPLSDGHAAERIEFPSDASATIRMVTAAGVLELVEDGAYGEVESLARAVGYRRDGGRSYWTTSDRGFEEWLLVDAGRAFADRVVATWDVGHQRMRMHEGAVLLVDSRGVPTMVVSAPIAWSRSGERVPAELRIVGERIALYVDADGDEVLVDPRFLPAGAMVVPRRHFGRDAAAKLPDGRVLVVGGYVPNGSGPLSSIEIYDPTTNTWSAGPPMRLARAGHTTTSLPDGRVLVVGGFSGYAVDRPEAEVYDPATNTWSDAGAMLRARADHTATLLANGKVLVSGGDWGGDVTSTSELFDPATNTWSGSANMGRYHMEHSALRLGDGTVFLTGGVRSSSTRLISERYDPVSNSWSDTGACTIDRHTSTVTLLPDGEVLVAGGDDFGGHSTAAVELFHPATNTFERIASMAAGRLGHSATLRPDGRVLVVGGRGAGHPSEVFDPTTRTWSEGPSLMFANTSSSSVVLDSGLLLVVSDRPAPAVSELLGEPDCAVYGGGCDAATSCVDLGQGPTCTMCPAGSASRTGRGDFPCSICPAGTSAGAPGSTVCAACPSEWFASSAGSSTCTPTTRCTAMQFETLAPTSTADRMCAPLTQCTVDQFELWPPTATRDRTCQFLRTCWGGYEYEAVAPTMTTDRVCAQYTYCNYLLEYDLVVATPTNDRVCAQRAVCHAGYEYEVTAGTTTTNRVCAAYTTCSAGEFVSVLETSTSDRICSPCSVCPAGTSTITQCSPTRDAVCTAPTFDAGVGNPEDASVSDASTTDAGADAMDAAGCSCRVGHRTDRSYVGAVGAWLVAIVGFGRRRRRRVATGLARS